MNKIVCTCISVLVLISCNNSSNKLTIALNEAGDNKNEIKKVLDFYKVNPKDSLKYKAAVFLIENMPYRNSYKPLKGFENAFDSISKYPMNNSRKEVFRKIFDSISKKVNLKEPVLVPDIKFLNSKYLIQNIELSFMSWNKIPKNKRASFEEFCNYILPYKNGNEPIEEYAREKLITKYSWVYKSLKSKVPLRTIVDSITSEFGHSSIENMGDYYPQPLSISQVEKTRVGTCDDGVNYVINVFKALGIISAKEMIPHWGNHYSLGHSWLYVKYGTEEYSTDVGGNVDLKTKYIGESIPKVYREAYKQQDNYVFTPFSQDVTAQYVPTMNASITKIFDTPDSQPLLCVFDVNNTWKPVSLGKHIDKHYVYKDIGVNVLYLACVQNNNDLIPINYPFYIDKTKQIHFFKPSKSLINSAPLLRKYGLSSPKSTRNIDWINGLNECVFQGAKNIDFKNAKTLYQISNFKSTHINVVKLDIKNKFNYVRFYSNKKEAYLAKVAFYDNNGKELIGDIFEKNNTVSKWIQGAFDDNPLSFSGGKEVSLGFVFNKPKQIGSIQFQVRNDDNHINIGNQYELFYWDKKWKTLGRQTAKDTVLYYDTPVNSLLWLRNLTKGREEHVFYIDKNKKQRWLGFYNY